MVRYELVVGKNSGWTGDQIFGSKEEAMGAARDLIERNPSISAVRVMMIENSNDGLTERPVCTVRAERKKQSAAHTLPKASSAAQSKGATNAMTARGASKARRGSSPAEMKVVALVVAACSALVLCGLLMPKQQWIFDTPNAHKPHMLRNAFSGELSK